MLSVAGCQQRLDRLRGVMSTRGFDLVVLTDPKNVYYFSGFQTPWFAAAALAVTPEEAVLVSNQEPAHSAATQVRLFDAQAIGTIRSDQQEQIATALRDLVANNRPVALEFSSAYPFLSRLITGEVIDVEPDVLLLRRRKDPDELALLRRSAACIDACYRRAREVIRPGLGEVELYRELHSAAVKAAGEPIGRFGQDFQCASPGGPPRDRAAADGELWILDLGVEYRGYQADASRAFAVGPTVSAEQAESWQAIVDCLTYAEQNIRPGVSCVAIYQEVKRRLDKLRPGSFFHHLGHGIGLAAHEAPYLNPHWSDVFEEGNVITVEPGVYGDSLRGGIRLEHDYLVTAEGVERLTTAPLELT